MKIAITVRGNTSVTTDAATGRVLIGPWSFGASRFVPEESSPSGPGDGRYVYEGEWAVPPQPGRQPS